VGHINSNLTDHSDALIFVYNWPVIYRYGVGPSTTAVCVVAWVDI
jgi:hypothetical protein